MSPRPLGSVVIPAHNEVAVIRRCLTTLLDGSPPDTLEVVVVCNGCTDGTADVARAVDGRVTVLEIAQSSKIAALQAADTWCRRYPRLYLDADVVVSGRAVVAVLQQLSADDALAARPPIAYDTSGCSLLVRRYYAARVLVPGLLDRLWGAGVFGLSERGRARFAEWPEVIGDDLFVDSLFSADEVRVVDTDPVVVKAPRTASALLGILRRGARAKAAEARARDRDGEVLPLRQSLRSTITGLVRVATMGPSAVVDVAVYAGFAVLCRLILPSARSAFRWERDESSRAAAP